MLRWLLVFSVAVLFEISYGRSSLKESPSTGGGGGGLWALPKSFVMPWFCLQRCGFNVSQIQEHVEQAVTMVTDLHVPMHVLAFERYNLGPNSTLVFNADLFDLNAYLKDNETRKALFPFRVAMISSFPYPPQFLDWMRQLFDNPEPFISDLITDLVAKDIHGVNVDFEPTSPNATSGDARRYAEFLRLLKQKLSTYNKFVTVAGATWSTIWNVSDIASALSSNSTTGEVGGYFTSMNTYTFQDAIYLQMLNYNIETFSVHGSNQSLVVGLETWPQNFTDKELKVHFSALAAHSICTIAIWDMPISPAMVPHLHNFSLRCHNDDQ